MSFLARSALALRAISASAPSSSRVAALPMSATTPLISRSLRFNSTNSSASSSSSEEGLPPKSSELFGSLASSSASSASIGSGTTNFQNLKFTVPSSSSTPGGAASSSSSSPEDAEAWWRETSRQASNHKRGYPTTIFTGRSIPVTRNGEFMTAYKRLQGLIRNSNMKKEARLTEYHEKPSVRRRRLISERHRRRFKEMVRTKVQQVISMRHRG
ncbi:ribosomal protein S21 [Kwoniella sp. CBS 9459]